MAEEKIFNRVIEKMFSGTYGSMMMMTITACFVMAACVIFVARGKMPVEIFLTIFTMFFSYIKDLSKNL